MKISKMKQVVAGIALSAVMIGATAFNAHPAFAERADETLIEKAPGVYRAAKELTETQKADLKWYQDKKMKLLKAGWQLEVDNGYMSQREKNAHVVATQERYQRALGTPVDKKVLSKEDRAAARKFVKKYRKATEQERQAMQLQKLKMEFDNGRISKNEFEARKIILKEASARKQDKRAQSPEYIAKKKELRGELKQLTGEYLQKARDNGSISQEQYQRILDRDAQTKTKTAS